MFCCLQKGPICLGLIDYGGGDIICINSVVTESVICFLTKIQKGELTSCKLELFRN